MNHNILESEPPSPEDSFLKEEFRKEIVKQADRMDDFAKELFKLEIAIPGIYATVLKFFMNPGASVSAFVIAAFICWAVALGLTLRGIIPKQYHVLEDVTERVGEVQESGRLTIQEYYTKIADRKRISLVLASASFFAGTVLAGISVFATRI